MLGLIDQRSGTAPQNPLGRRVRKRDEARLVNSVDRLAGRVEQQLLLLAEMCLSREMNCILSLEEEYSYELLVCGIWQNILVPLKS